MATETVTLPKRIIEEVLEASEALITLQDELEDYLIGRHSGVLKKLRRAHREHLAGKVKPFIFPPSKSR